ncbi:MAG: hypothetical protein JSV88_33405, partial [Candidatus Aminicenantes bacterium]
MKLKKNRIFIFLFFLIIVWGGFRGNAREARYRWEMMNQIRRDKFDLILPKVMRENNIDMWITVMKEGNYGPLFEDLGRGYISDIAYYVFTDLGGDRIERAVLGIDGYSLRQCGAYDIFGSAGDLKEFVRKRDPKRIGINISEKIGAADSLTYMSYLHLKKTLGKPYSERLVSA